MFENNPRCTQKISFKLNYYCTIMMPFSRLFLFLLSIFYNCFKLLNLILCI